MADKMQSGLFERLINKVGFAHWKALAAEAHRLGLSRLRDETQQARQLRHHLDDLIATGEERLTFPRGGADSFPQPHGTDWAWRPDPWRKRLPGGGLASVETGAEIGSGVQVFHDCRLAELIVSQDRNQSDLDLAPYGVALEVFDFEGSFLSFVINLPPEALHQLDRKHLVRLACHLRFEKPIAMFARLNIKSGPNTEQVLREVPHGEEERVVEFDLAYLNIETQRIEDVWVDLFFEEPQMNRIVISDLTLCRYPRATF